jgi:hypothetical protein
VSPMGSRASKSRKQFFHISPSECSNHGAPTFCNERGLLRDMRAHTSHSCPSTTQSAIWMHPQRCPQPLPNLMTCPIARNGFCVKFVVHDIPMRAIPSRPPPISDGGDVGTNRAWPNLAPFSLLPLSLPLQRIPHLARIKRHLKHNCGRLNKCFRA